MAISRSRSDLRCSGATVCDRRPTDPPRTHALWASTCALCVLVACTAPVSPAPEPGAAALVVVDGCQGVLDGALCNDKNACTVNDRCLAGVCVGALATDGMPCTDDNQCTVADMCVKGACRGTAVIDGTSCTDGDPCTEPDTCRMGLCTSGSPVSCDDGDQCTTDRCVEGDGCHHDPLLMCPDASISGDGGSVDADAAPPPDGSPLDVGADTQDGEGGEAGEAGDASLDA